MIRIEVTFNTISFVEMATNGKLDGLFKNITACKYCKLISPQKIVKLGADCNRLQLATQILNCAARVVKHKSLRSLFDAKNLTSGMVRSNSKKRKGIQRTVPYWATRVMPSLQVHMYHARWVVQVKGRRDRVGYSLIERGGQVVVHNMNGDLVRLVLFVDRGGIGHWAVVVGVHFMSRRWARWNVRSGITIRQAASDAVQGATGAVRVHDGGVGVVRMLVTRWGFLRRFFGR